MFNFLKKKQADVFVPSFDRLLQEVLHYVPNNEKWHKVEITFYAKSDGATKVADEFKIRAIPIENNDLEGFMPFMVDTRGIYEK